MAKDFWQNSWVQGLMPQQEAFVRASSMKTLVFID